MRFLILVKQQLKLIDKFKSVKGIREASLSEVSMVVGNARGRSSLTISLKKRRYKIISIYIPFYTTLILIH